MDRVLLFHIGAGALGVASGIAALIAPKGSMAHRRLGLAFIVSMASMAITAALLGADPGNLVAAVLVLYFLVTAWRCARPNAVQTGLIETISGMVALGVGAALALEANLIATGAKPAANPYIVYVSFTLAAAIALAGLGDFSVASRRTLPRSQRIARHLWRMCMTLLIAVGAFAAQGAAILPAWVPRLELLFASMLIVAVVMIFWLIRVLAFRKPIHDASVPTPARSL